MNQAFIIDGVRTPIGKYAGALSSVRPDDLAAHVIKELVSRNPQVKPEAIEDVVFGCTNQAGEDNRNVARMALLIAGLPISVTGLTVNRLCASGASAVVNAARCIAVGEGDFYIAGGVESMSRAPYVQAKPEQAFSKNPEIYDTSIGWRFVNPKLAKLHGCDSMGQTAENVAEQFNISREDQDKFALWSQQKAAKALSNNIFAREIAAVHVPQKKSADVIVDTDEYPRPSTTLEALSKLKPVFKENGTVTAGNASGINDGACALLLASENGVKSSNLKPISRIVSSAVVGLEPRIMGMGPVGASKKALQKANLSLDDIDIIEINEAFASQCVASLRELGLSDNDRRVNPNGGAISLGHPLGMSGARLITTASYELAAQKKKYALCTMCIGVGQGFAVIIERV